MVNSNQLRKKRGASIKDRRREPRLKMEVRTKIRLISPEKIADNAGPKELWAFTSEISAGGTRILVPVEFKPGDQVDLQLFLSRIRKAIRLEATVRWQQMTQVSGLYETGFEFTKISPVDKLALMEFLYLDRSQKKKKEARFDFITRNAFGFCLGFVFLRIF